MRRRDSRAWVWAWAALLPLSAACGGFADFSSEGPRDASPPDAAAEPNDASFFDGGIGDGIGLPASETAPPVDLDLTDRAVCYVPDEPELLVPDCTHPWCPELASCRVGDGELCAAIASPLLPSSADFTACDAGGTVADCFVGQEAQAAPFGSPGPRLESGGLAPGGGSTHDAGAVLGEPVDLRTTRVEVTAVFLAATGCGASCVEGAAVSLTTQATFDDATVVRPLVGVVYTGSGHEVRLVVADQTVGKWPRPSDGVVKLTVRPTGHVTLQLGADGAESTAEAAFVPAPAARLVLHGRNREPGAWEHARVASVTVSAQACDMPSVWTSRGLLTVLDAVSGEPAALGEVLRPALAHGADGTAWLAFEERRDDASVIRVARRNAGGDPWTFTLVDDAASPALAPSTALDARGVHEPALVVLPDPPGTLVLLYAAVDDSGMRTIARATASPADAIFTPDVTPALSPYDLQNVWALGFPTVARRSDGVWAVIVQVWRVEGSSLGGPVWRIFTSDDANAGSTLVPLDGAASFLPSTVGIGPYLDLGGTGSPSLALHGHAWRLFYDRPRGTRPEVAALASDELLVYRHLEAGDAVLEGTGLGFDALGAHGPAASVHGSLLELVYLGFDGTTSRLGLAHRPVP
jgi:hypothetical protein